MGQIKVLDRNMINMIAAGEVIERPASVVKELMENSIDAGATNITVFVEDGGRKLISVSDNGAGMDGEDLLMAFEPHATSKIKDSSDLHHISTLGFRGEALASIASVAQVRAVSRVKNSAAANCIEIDCGDKGGLTPCSAGYGTTIQIRDLFYKLPARRKFLKTANTEMAHIVEQFMSIALPNVNLDMTLIHNGRELYKLAGGAGVRQRIAELFSHEISENLIETESTEKGLYIFALLGRPAVSRTSNKLQYVFLNSRFLHDKFISHAIKEAYRGCLEPNRFPVAFLFIQMPPEDYDINVHPTKIEVRFYNANLVHSQIMGCLREKLLATNLDVPAKLPQAQGTVEGHGKQAAGGGSRNKEIADAMAEFFKRHKPAQAQEQFKFPSAGRNISSPLERTKQIAENRYTPLPKRKFLQIKNTFIVAETNEGFTIVDQHALHERIMYQDLCAKIQEGNLQSQKLLIPETFELNDRDSSLLKSNEELLEKLGIELAPFGPRTMAIQAFPSLLAKISPADFVKDLLDLLGEAAGRGMDEKGLLDEILNMAACKAAIKAGQYLNDSEIEQLLADKEVTEYASRCPHGRPTAINFSKAELEKQFKRT